MQAHGDDSQLDRLARDLGTTADAVRALGYVWAPRADRDHYDRLGLRGADGWRSCWVCPMRDGDMGIVALHRRFADGRKMTAAKQDGDPAANGLYYPDDLLDRAGPILVAEGPSDAAAGWAAGLAVVGRPNDTGGAHHLAHLLRDHRDREVIVLGENDRKESGLWPGRDAAEKVARQLTTAGLQDVKWGLVPGGIKDLRAWLAAHPGEDFLAALRAQGLVCVSAQELVVLKTVEPTKSCAPRPTIYGHLSAEAVAQPPPAACPSRATEVLAHRRQEGKYRVANLPCDCWRCEQCRQRKAARLCAHLAGCTQQALDAARPLRAVELTGEERTRVRAALARAAKKAGAPLSYAELQRPGGTYLLLFALAVATLPERVRHAEPLSPEEAAEKLGGWCLEAKATAYPEPANNGRVRPVNTSADWRMPRPPPSGAWKIVGGCSALEQDTVEEELARAGVTKVWECDWPDLGLERPPYVWAVEFTAAPEDRERVLRVLACADDPRPDASPFADLPP
jgi:hypothetical protein